jgi:tetratricopeptide (TPR) repeat protein
MDIAKPKYRAFISYSHLDERWGSWLHKKLETYRVHKHLVGRTTARGTIPRRLLPVFRDREELASATDLGETITAALQDSEALIVVCSPAAAQSHWVNEEILTFKRLGRADSVFCVIVDGEPNASDTSEPERECFPPALRFHLGESGELSSRRAEPIAADARDGKDGKNGAQLKLTAGLLGVGLDELQRREQHRRQRRLIAITSASLAGMVVASVLAGAALFARAEAIKQRSIAETEAQTARQTTDFLVSLFQVSDPNEARGNAITAREILDRGAREIETNLQQQPTVRANLLHTLGRVYTGLGLYAPATGFLEQAVSLRRDLSSDPDAKLVASANSLGAALYLKGEYEVAEATYRGALDAARVVYPEAHADTTAAMNGLADVLTQFERDDEAEPLFREALAIDRDLHGERHPDVARSMAGLATSLLFQGRTEEAEPLFRDALDIRVETLGDDHPLVAETGNNLASLYYFAGDNEASEREMRDALRRYRHIYGDEHPEVSSIVNNLGRLLLERNKLTEAEEMLRNALAVDRKLKDPGHDDLTFPLNSLGLTLSGLDKPEEAEALFLEALNIARAHDHRLQGPVLTNLSDLYCRTGRYADAAGALQSAAPLLQEDYAGEAWRLANLESVRGACMAAAGKYPEAEVLLLESFDAIEKRWGTESVFTRNAVFRLIALYENWDKPQKAAALRSRYGV